MKFLFFLILLSFSAFAEKFPEAATGLEAGVSRISDGKRNTIGTSWAYHFEYRPDKYVAFFGHTGQNSGEKDGKHLQQNFFAGGGELYLLPVLNLRLGLAHSVCGTHKEFAPLAGLSVSDKFGIFRPGITAEVIRAPVAHSFSLRGFLYIEI